jgi:RNA polymerase sigma-70 factor (ECF subfamily)
VAETSIGFDLTSLARARAGRAEEIPDHDLVEGLQAGDERAYETLIERYQQPVFNLVYRLVEHPADSRDVVQEVFLKVFRHIGSFRQQSCLKTWIYRIAVNEACNHRRWFHRHGKQEVALENPEEDRGRSLAETLRDPSRSPYEITLGGETRTLIEQELAGLKRNFRQAVVLRDMEDLPYDEIAEVLDVSIGTVKSRIRRGREALRERLRDRLSAIAAPGWPQPAEQE